MQCRGRERCVAAGQCTGLGRVCLPPRRSGAGCCARPATHLAVSVARVSQPVHEALLVHIFDAPRALARIVQRRR